MSFQSVYISSCNFQESVVGAEYPSNRTLQAPKAYPSALEKSTLPIFLNSFGRFSRDFLADGMIEYRGTMQWTLYTAIAGTQEAVVNQFDTINWIDTAVSKIEAYPYLQISGVANANLIDPLQVTDVEPLIPNLRYAGNGAQLFWGGRITLSVVIEIPKDC